MIAPPGATGVAFSDANDGDLRGSGAARERISSILGISHRWSWARQVHGNRVLEVSEPGEAGEADALWSMTPHLPLVVFTADCVGVVLQSDAAVGVAHAGWRGASDGVVSRLFEEMTLAGHEPSAAFLGPAIGSCCYEVGEDVAGLFEARSQTTWGTSSVDLARSVRGQLKGVDVWSSGACTYHEQPWFSHRRDRTPERLATIAWIP